MEDLAASTVGRDCSNNGSGNGNGDGNERLKGGREGLDALLTERGVLKVDWKNYEKIDAKEKDPSRLRTSDQPREKITSLDEMLQLIK